MKPLIALFFILFFCVSIVFAQKNAIKETPEMPIDESTGKITFTDVIYLQDSTISKDVLFSKAQEWFAKTYNSSKSVLQMNDKESGKLIGKALMQVYHKAMGKDYESGHINYTISIFVKDGRYKYEITDLHHTGQLSGSQKISDYGPCEEMINTTHKTMGASHQKLYNYYLLQVKENIEALVANLIAEMQKTSVEKKGDDW